jgi:hypothetical protein
VKELCRCLASPYDYHLAATSLADIDRESRCRIEYSAATSILVFSKMAPGSIQRHTTKAVACFKLSLTCTGKQHLLCCCNKPFKFLNTKRHAVQVFYKVLLCGIIIQRRICADSMRAFFYLFFVCL